MKKLLELYIFWVMLILSKLALIYTYCFGTWDLNRTIGWGWEITNFIWWIMPSISCSIIVFTIGYGILFFTNKKTKFFLSFLQIFLLLIYLFIPFHQFELLIFIVILSWIVFILNMANSEVV